MSTNSTSRYANRLSLSFIFWLIFCATLLTAGGVTVAVFKSQQVAERTEIEQIRKEIAVCRMNASQYRSKINAETNRWVMLSRIKREHSDLREVQRDQIETMRLHSGNVASTSDH